MTQTVSIKDMREKLAEVVNRVSIAGDTFVVTKFGQPKAMVVPIPQGELADKSGVEESFGAWRKRNDIKNSNKWVARLRATMSKRNE